MVLPRKAPVAHPIIALRKARWCSTGIKYSEALRTLSGKENKRGTSSEGFRRSQRLDHACAADPQRDVTAFTSRPRRGGTPAAVERTNTRARPNNVRSQLRVFVFTKVSPNGTPSRKCRQLSPPGRKECQNKLQMRPQRPYVTRSNALGNRSRVTKEPLHQQSQIITNRHACQLSQTNHHQPLHK
ncbi:hypothetical protein EVAR_97547_1 [Eumeta japonica]|uniref:Uncharacterized protein n=1 Tax=Eumeta variegata TaxID=151549 RepID=A0A4C1SFF1_EUMVA|nr:hypothetical protein EVAR_97547_1 [Eumeta japonica]